MARQAVKPRLPWEDRWSEPTLDQLLSSIVETHRPVFSDLIQGIDAYDRFQRSMFWYGVSWKWTLHYQLFNEQGKPIGTFCYLVPRFESPMICIPLSAEQINALPFKRLNKIIRDGIRSAKCALETHWAIWTPSNQTDLTHLMDLIKRLHKMAFNSQNGQKKAS